LAFQQTSDGPGIITDFNDLIEHNHIAISASGFGGGLTAGMDATSVFESSADLQFSGSGAVSDTSNQTRYFIADGTQSSVITVAQVQAGVTLNAHNCRSSGRIVTVGLAGGRALLPVRAGFERRCAGCHRRRG
jgi:hypothetical protein